MIWGNHPFMPSRIYIIAIISMFLTACSSFNPLQSSQTDNLPTAIVIGAPSDSTATPTPFQPIPPTPTFIPTEYPESGILMTPTISPFATSPAFPANWAGYPGPIVYPPIEIPPPMGIWNQPSGQTNILIMGSDQRPNDGGFRTDVLLLLTLNTELGTATLTSFPRDLYVYIPGWTMERINTAHARGGFDLTATTFEYNFGVRPDYWVLINFYGFTTLVDALGGIDVQVGQTLSDHRDSYGNYIIPAGLAHMDGETALWYVRSRGTSSDFDRTRRQQEVLQAIFYRTFSIDGVSNAPQLYQQYRETMLTNMSFEDILPLLPIAAQLTDSSRIHRYAIGINQVTPWVNPYNGAQVLLPIQDAVRIIMQQALNIQ